MIIEEVRACDAQAILDIYAPYVSDTAISFEYDVPTLQEFTDRINNISAKYPYIKAVDNGRIVGYAYATNFKSREAYNWSVETTIYISKEERGRGIGKALYEELEKQLQAMGILNMNACIAAPSKQTEYLTDDSILFHTHMGFTEVGRFHDSGFKFGEWFDMIWMEKMIGEHNAHPVSIDV